MKRFIIIILIVLFSGKLFSQYYQQYSQYISNGQAINPAYAGSHEVLSTTLSYRDQWVGFDGAPKTMTFSAHTPLNKMSSAVGLQLFSDRIGVSKHNGIFFSYAYRIRFKKNNRILAFGTGAGLSMFRSNLNSVTINNSGDKAFEGQFLKSNRPNFSLGIYYYSNRFFAGLSVPSILHYGYDVFNNTNDSLKTSARNIYYSVGYVFKLNSDIKFVPSCLIKSYPGLHTQMDLNFKLCIYDVLGMSFSLRFGDAMIWIIDYKMNNQLSIGYSHDFSSSILNRFSHGTNEFLLKYKFAYKSNLETTKLF
jgi:type IX secretion system PorP/SprF family membrane protein